MRRSDRRSRSKARKPRYLSLRRYLAPPPPISRASPSPPPAAEDRSPSSPFWSPPSSDMSSSSSSPAAASAAVAGCDDAHREKQQKVDLVPIYSDHLDRDPCLLILDDDSAAAAGVGGEEPPTLAALLGDAAGATDSSGSPASPTSSSMNQDGDCCGTADGDRLARRALRGRERWVYYRSSAAAAGGGAASSPSEEEASSGGVDLWWRCTAAAGPTLALKLDYEEILTAWSDRGSLYIDGDDGAQVVPQLHHDADPYDSATAIFFPVMVEVGGGACKLPESRAEAVAGGDRAAEAKGTAPEMSREDRVRRYKEKRQSRLFAKRIRYEVRKINAEKRPRWKGRFIKRVDDKDDALDSSE